ncbi:ABC transporter permease [Paenibacillus lutrae]|uniref:ABC transporter permease subunit n=1 Tax=Paenibacillus lutrae TaxID=2078573 RepID=A0A7X3FHW3_9BACL|nr:ABC transporter permease [Paenibacillus lutrae]MVO99921.1 ABC transporter permease subunit [Paenibacillus lutrae]
MTFSWKRSMAILQKDFKDISKNLYVSTTLFIPLLMAAMYSRMGIETVNSYFMVFNITFTLVATFIQCSLIAEEKEKNTLRGLMLSPASTLDIIGGKSLLSLIGTVIILAASMLLMEYNPANIVLISLALLFSAVFYIGMGTLLGLVTKNVMEASVAVMPIFLLFSFGSLITAYTEQYPILKIAEYMPNIQLVELANQVESGAGLAGVWPNLGVILLWAIVVHILTVVVYKKRMVDE